MGIRVRGWEVPRIERCLGKLITRILMVARDSNIVVISMDGVMATIHGDDAIGG